MTANWSAGPGASPEEGPDPDAPPVGTSETEATLAIRSEDPEEIAREVASLDRIGDYALRRREAGRFRDSYFDTPAGELRRRGVALRLRRSDERTLLGLKGESRSLPDGGIDRREWEGEWSAVTFAEIRGALEERGVSLPAAPSLAPRDDAVTEGPEEVLLGLGLRVVQERETHRRESEIISPGGETAAGVVAVDAVEFRAAGGRAVTHHEVEVEAGRVEDPAALLRATTAALRARFPQSLVPWDRSKLETGRAVAEATAAEGYAAVADSEGRMRPEAYDLLRRRLRAGDAGEAHGGRERG